MLTLTLLTYGVHLRTKIIENKRQFEVQKLDYPCRNLVIWIWNRNERSRNSIIRTWSYFEQVETIKGKLDIADVEVQITIPTKMKITWFELQFTFSTLISHLIDNNATIIVHKIQVETFNLNLKSRHIFEFEKPTNFWTSNCLLFSIIFLRKCTPYLPMYFKGR